MSSAAQKHASGGRRLDTLAEGRKLKYTATPTKVYGVGHNVKAEKAKDRRGKTKVIGNALALGLAEVAEERKDSAFVKRCFNTYYCLSEVIYERGVIYGDRCKNRFCPTCMGIRKADMINKYYHTLSQWDSPRFLTLTNTGCPADELKALIKEQKRIFRLILDKYRKRYDSGQSIKLIGLRSHECNFNPKKNTYNPHFHIITNSSETAKILNVEWLNYWGKPMARPGAQLIRRVGSLEKDLVETIKYGSKIFTDPEMKKSLASKDRKIYVRALYEILKAFDNKHLLSSFGFKLPEQEDEKNEGKIILNASTLKYIDEFNDWVNPETGSMLTRYKPENELKWMLSNMDKVKF